MSTLEVLMKAEKSLSDEGIRFNYASFYDCTCGHILRAVEGKRGYAGPCRDEEHPEYLEVMHEVAKVLGYGDGEEVDAVFYVSNHTARQPEPGRMVTRQDALKTIRTAMLALQINEVQTEEYATA